MENNQTNEKQQDYELQAVPDSARKGFLPMFMIMMGFTFFSASMSVGGQLGIGLNMTKFIWALLIGNAILGVYTGIPLSSRNSAVFLASSFLTLLNKKTIWL